MAKKKEVFNPIVASANFIIRDGKLIINEYNHVGKLVSVKDFRKALKQFRKILKLEL